MAVNFDGSTQYLTNSTILLPSTAYSFTVGCWAYFNGTADGTYTIWSVADTGTSTNVLDISFYNEGAGWGIRIDATIGGTDGIDLSDLATVAGWYFYIYRGISSTNRSLAAILPDGTVRLAATAQAYSPTGIDAFSVGASVTSIVQNLFLGMVAEFWYTDSDIQPDGTGGPINTSTLFQLAYGGPFSIPAFAGDVMEYHSFNKSIGSLGDDLGSSYGNAKSSLVATGNPTCVAGPNLPYWYARPNQVKRKLLI